MRRGFLILIIMGAAQLSAEERRTIVLGVTEWSPYTSESLPGEGIHAQLTRLALGTGGVDVEIRFMPWTRVLKSVEAGLIDGAISLFKNPERETYAVFTDPLTIVTIALLKLKDAPIPSTFSRLEDLKSYTIGFVRDYNYTPLFNDNTTLKKEISLDEEMNERKFFGGRIDYLIVVSTEHFFFRLNRKYPERVGTVIMVQPPIRQQGITTAFSRKTPDHHNLVKIFNEGLERLKKDGTYARLNRELLTSLEKTAP